MYKVTHILKNSKQRIPDALLDKVLAEFPTVLGVCIAKDGSLHTVKSTDAVNLDQINQIQDGMPDDAVLFTLGNYPAGFVNDDIQPFTVLTDTKDQPELVAVLQGEFPGFAQEKSAHPNTFFASSQWLVPKLRKIFATECDGKISKLMDALVDPVTRREIEAMLSPSGMLTLVSKSGEIMTFHNNLDATKYEWGWATDTCGYMEDQPETLVEEEKPKSLLGSLMQKVKPAAAVAEAEDDDDDDEEDDEVHDAASPITDGEMEEVSITVPTNLNTKEARRSWFLKHVGHVPNGYKRLKTFTFKRAKAIKSLQDERLKTVPTVDPNMVKDTTTKHIAAVEPIKSSMVEAVAPIMEVEDLTAFRKLFLDGATVKHSVDLHSQVIADPTLLQTELGKNQKPWTEMGVAEQDAFVWDREALLDMGNAAPEMLAAFAWEWRAENSKYKAWMAGELSKKIEPKKEIAPATTTTVPKVAAQSGGPRRQRIQM